MSFWDKMKNFTQPYSDEDYDDYEDGMDEFEDAPQEAAPKATRRPSPFSKLGEPEPAAPVSAPAAPSNNSGFSGQVLNMNSGKQEVVLFHARTFDDAAKAANELRKKKAVILNMENVDKALTRRVVDFLSGAVYALDGSVKKVAQSAYLFCPHNMGVVGDLENVQVEMESHI